MGKLSKEYFKIYYKEHKDDILAYHKNYYNKNKETILSANKIYRENNKEKISAKSREYYVAHKDEFSLKSKTYRDLNKEEIAAKKKKYAKDNVEKLKEYKRNYYLRNKEKIKLKSQKWFNDNKEKHNKQCKEWAEKNHERRLEIIRNYNHKVRSTPKGNLSSTISKRINESLCKGMKAGRHWESLVNYTVDDLKNHIEKQFTSEMSWGNYGSYWHIDHIIPIAAFNFEKPEDIDFKRCWSLDNLQPLEASKNMSKRDKVDVPFQPSLAIAV